METCVYDIANPTLEDGSSMLSYSRTINGFAMSLDIFEVHMQRFE